MPSRQITTAGSANRSRVLPEIFKRMTARAAQNPIDGRYKNRSAMMLPIVRIKFEVGSIMAIPQENSLSRFRR